MNQKHYLIKGTLLLTIMGGLTRIAGFFYKIFLSRTIGASEIGRYQLAIPAFTFCTALCGGGVQTAISRFVAEYTANGDVRGAKRTLCAGLIWSVSLSIVCSTILYINSAFIASRLLLEESCAGLLRVMAFSLPFSMIHRALSGYFMGRKNVLPPALAQLIEQMTRILFAVFTYLLFYDGSRQPDAGLMAAGQLAGEAASALYCAGWMFLSQHFSLPGNAPDKNQKTGPNQVPPCRYSYNRHFSAQARLLSSLLRGNKHQTGTCLHTDSRFAKLTTSFRKRFLKIIAASRQLLSVSLPLGLNRMLMCVLQTIEAALLPQMLQSFGHTSTEALSVYGTLTGMAMPMLLFPTAATSALGMLLLPTISEVHALHRQKQISDTVHAAFLSGMMLGSFCLGAFLLFGQNIGSMVFQNSLAGTCIRQMALVCPLIYINTTMTGILHGLGRSVSLLVWNV
ncbi:MAG: oligosaccharide flippase family protein, partial [Lachnospiraceae bacterium]|nr:oligosaccharide flippase family protein [Lachnospiraceae bacterium]